MSKTDEVKQIEEARKFLRLYHEEEITALNISRLLDFSVSSSRFDPKNPYYKIQFGQSVLDKELKDVYQAIRKSTFLKHFSYHSSEVSWQNIRNADDTIRHFNQKTLTITQEIETLRKDFQQKQHQYNQKQHSEYNSKTSSLTQESTNIIPAIIKQWEAKQSLLFQHESLIKALTPNKYLTHINLEKMFMGDELGSLLSKIFLVNKVISHFNVSHNNLGELGGMALANALAKYPTLTHFNISNNTTSVKVVEKLAESFESNGNLLDLNLGYQKWGKGGDDAIRRIIEANPSLSYLDISSISLQITEIVEMLIPPQPIIESFMPTKGNIVLLSIKNHPSLTYLNISSCFHSYAETNVADSIAELLANNNNIAEINIASNQLKATALAKISAALKSNTKLKTLDISSNYLGEDGGEVIADLLLGNHSITKLNASTNDLGYGGIQPIANALKSNSSLLEMVITSNNLDEAGGLLMGKALAQNQTLITLDLSDNNIQAIGALYIAQALLENKHLKHLNLSANHLGREGVTSLCKATISQQNFTPIDSLITLNLSKNDIDYIGATFLATALNHNTALVDLYLDNNSLHHTGIRSIVEAIHNNPHTYIVRLGLSNTQMGDQGAKELLDFLKSNLTIAYLDINRNNITQAGAQYIHNLLKDNVSITRLKMSQHLPLSQNPDEIKLRDNLQDIFESIILPSIPSSSIIELPEASDRLYGCRLFSAISKHRDVLQSNLRKLETLEGEGFSRKQLFILLKQLQGRTSESVLAELSYADMKSDEFYIKRIAKIFNEKYYKPTQVINSGMEHAELSSNMEEAEAVTDKYFDALVDSKILGYVDTFIDVVG